MFWDSVGISSLGLSTDTPLINSYHSSKSFSPPIEKLFASTSNSLSVG